MAKYDKKHMLAVVALALAALSGGTSFAIVKDTLNSMKPFTLMAIRFVTAAILIGSIFAKRFRNITKKDLVNNLIIGIFLFFAFLTLVIGVAYTTASKQAFLVGAYVLVVPFLSWRFNNKRPSIYAVVGVVMATFGIALLTLDGSLNINRGDVLSIMCALFFACHMVSIEYFNKDCDPIVSSTIQIAVTGVIFLVLALVYEPPQASYSSGLIKALLYLTIVSTVFTFVAQNIAQKFISSTTTALVFTLETAFGGLFAVYLLNEKMTVQMTLGCIMIFAAIFIEETKLQFLKRNDIKATD